MSTDPLSGTYCFYWSYEGYLENGSGFFEGPRTDAGGRGRSKMLVSDYFGYDYYESPNAYGSCEKFKGASLVSGTMMISGYWAGESYRTSPKPEIKLNAGYVDGHVEGYSSPETASMLVIRKPETGEPYPDGTGPGKFFIPQNALR
jgi:prepilin-type processing-associated H-X9-DG protein